MDDRYEKIDEEFSGTLLGALRFREVPVVEAHGIRLVKKDNEDTYSVEVISEFNTPVAYAVETPHEAVIVALSDIWNIDFDRAFDLVFQAYRIPKVPEHAEIVEPTLRHLAMFRAAREYYVSKDNAWNHHTPEEHRRT